MFISSSISKPSPPLQIVCVVLSLACTPHFLHIHHCSSLLSFSIIIHVRVLKSEESSHHLKIITKGSPLLATIGAVMHHRRRALPSCLVSCHPVHGVDALYMVRRWRTWADRERSCTNQSHRLNTTINRELWSTGDKVGMSELMIHRCGSKPRRFIAFILCFLRARKLAKYKP